MGRKTGDAQPTRREVKAAAKAAQSEVKSAARQATADAQAAEKSAKKAAKRAACEAKTAAKAAAKEAKALGTGKAKASRGEARAARQDAKAARRDAKATTRSAKATKREAKAATKAAHEAVAATKPARAIGKLTDPKIAKRAVAVGKVLAPALAPVLLKAATGTRGYLDQQRAHRLGVPVEQVGEYRGPTGAVGARLTGLGDSIRELAQRRDNDLQVTRFTEVASSRLADLTAAVQACASMPRARRSEVLRAVGHELDSIDADLVAHLMSPRQR